MLFSKRESGLRVPVPAGHVQTIFERSCLGRTEQQAQCHSIAAAALKRWQDTKSKVHYTVCVDCDKTAEQPGDGKTFWAAAAERLRCEAVPASKN